LREYNRSLRYLQSIVTVHSSVANVLLFPIPANVTDDVAAPHEVALAFLLHLSDPRLVSPAATQQSATVNSLTGPIAYPAVSPQDTEPATQPSPRALNSHITRLRFVLLAVVRRVVQIHQICLVRFLQVGTDGSQFLPPPVDELHMGGPFVPLEQRLPHLSERRQTSPADLHAAGAGHSVTLAGALHPGPDPLQQLRSINSTYTTSNLTLLPASLLWRFMSPVAVFASSFASRNSLLNLSPCLMSSEQPPHFHFCDFFCRILLSQEQPASSLFEHALVTAKATLAADTADKYAASLLPATSSFHTLPHPPPIPTDCDNVSERDVLLWKRSTIPSAVPELVLALVHRQLGAISENLDNTSALNWCPRHLLPVLLRVTRQTIILLFSSYKREEEEEEEKDCLVSFYWLATNVQCLALLTGNILSCKEHSCFWRSTRSSSLLQRSLWAAGVKSTELVIETGNPSCLEEKKWHCQYVQG
jgi:hypothetical protein